MKIEQQYEFARANKSIIASFNHFRLDWHLRLLANTFVPFEATALYFRIQVLCRQWLPLQLSTTMVMDILWLKASQSLKPFVVHNTWAHCEWARLWFTALLMCVCALNVSHMKYDECVHLLLLLPSENRAFLRQKLCCHNKANKIHTKAPHKQQTATNNKMPCKMLPFFSTQIVLWLVYVCGCETQVIERYATLPSTRLISIRICSHLITYIVLTFYTFRVDSVRRVYVMSASVLSAPFPLMPCM